MAKYLDQTGLTYFWGKIKGWVNNSQHPIGSIYMSISSTSPASLFGGTWEQIKDTFLLACGDTYAAGSTGGEAQHKLTVAEIASHSHFEELGDKATPQNINMIRRKVASSETQGVFISATYTASGLGDYIRTADAGGSQPHNNMPPYLAVYMWKRVS